MLFRSYTQRYEQVMFTLNSDNKVLDLLYLKRPVNEDDIEKEYSSQILNESQKYEKICFVDGIKPDFCLRTGEKRIKIRTRVKEKERNI